MRRLDPDVAAGSALRDLWEDDADGAEENVACSDEVGSDEACLGRGAGAVSFFLPRERPVMIATTTRLECVEIDYGR